MHYLSLTKIQKENTSFLTFTHFSLIQRLFLIFYKKDTNFVDENDNDNVIYDRKMVDMIDDYQKNSKYLLSNRKFIQLITCRHS